MSSDKEISFPEEVKAVEMSEQKVFDGIPFPLVLNPADGFQNKNADFWKGWVETNPATLQQLLVKYGAILFRNFPFDTPKDFDDFAKAFGYKEFPYVGGGAVRVRVVGNTFTASEAPPGNAIPFHHEMAHVRDYPLILFFYCDTPSKEGGQTPILLSNVVYRKMAEIEPEFVSRLENESLRYTRIVPDQQDITSHIGRNWRSTFLAKDKEEAERNAKAVGYEIEWLEDGSVRTTTPELPGVRIDERTGKKMWFNSIAGVHYAWTDARNDGSKAATFPNGETVPQRLVNAIERAMDEAEVSFDWQRRDALLIDNRTVQHARAAHFVPPRRILASLYSDDDGPLAFVK